MYVITLLLQCKLDYKPHGSDDFFKTQYFFPRFSKQLSLLFSPDPSGL